MIDLYDIKFLNTYTYYGALPSSPADGDTWLSDGTEAGYPSGYSYQYDLSGTTWNRIETKEDSLTDINAGINNVLEYLNNFFYVVGDNFQDNGCDECCYDPVYDNYVYLYDSNLEYNADSTQGKISTELVIPFVEGDLIQITRALRNSGVGYVTEVGADYIVTDNALRTDTGKGLLALCNIPADLEAIIRNMIHYDVYTRTTGTPANLSSEKIGNYSYNANVKTTYIGGYDYPVSLVSGLELYRKVRFYA